MMTRRGASPDPMLRAHLSFAAMWAGECAFMVALGVVAFREGGVGAVGAITAARMACAALLAPFLATLADRVRRERVLICVGGVRAAMLGGAAVATATGAPAAVTYGLAVVATVAVTMYRPAHSSLLPALAKSPQQLAGANAVRGMLDSLSTLLGPLTAAALLAASGPTAVLVASAIASLVAGLVVVGLPVGKARRSWMITAKTTVWATAPAAWVAGASMSARDDTRMAPPARTTSRPRRLLGRRRQASRPVPTYTSSTTGQSAVIPAYCPPWCSTIAISVPATSSPLRADDHERVGERPQAPAANGSLGRRGAAHRLGGSGHGRTHLTHRRRDRRPVQGT